MDDLVERLRDIARHRAKTNEPGGSSPEIMTEWIAADEIETFRSEQARFDAAEKEETLSGYCELFSHLTANGYSTEGANAYVVAKATFEYTNKIALLEAALKPFAGISSITLFPEGGMEMAKHFWTVIGTPDRTHFTQDDLVRARAALNQ